MRKNNIIRIRKCDFFVPNHELNNLCKSMVLESGSTFTDKIITYKQHIVNLKIFFIKTLSFAISQYDAFYGEHSGYT